MIRRVHRRATAVTSTTKEQDNIMNTTKNTNQMNRRGIFSAALLMILSLLISMPAAAQYSNPASVNLLTAGNFRILAGTAVTIGTGNTINGDVGISPGTSVTNSGTVTGSIHIEDASSIQAQSDLTTVYTDVSGRSIDETVGSELGGTTLGRGVYTSAAGTFSITGTLTLNGTASDIFIFRMATTLTTGAASSVVLTGGALSSNIYWVVGSSATIDGDFKGVILANMAITQNVSSVINGRVLARNSFVTVNGNGVLPVELISFTARTVTSHVGLSWTTATEVNNYGFEIQRSDAGDQMTGSNAWAAIGFVEGNGTSNTAHEYSFSDRPKTAGTFFYRLKQIDRDGEFAFSNSVEVNAGEAPSEYVLLQNYPNPFNPSTKIEYRVPSTVHVTLTVYDMIGNEVSVLVNKAQEQGTYSLQFDGSQLSSGVYFYRLNAGTFSSVKKFTLMK